MPHLSHGEGKFTMKKDHLWLAAYSKIFTGKKVLELGCGPGIDTRMISKFTDFIVATDLKVKPEFENPVLLLDHSKSLPFDDGSFDVVVASLCLHYFSLQKTAEIITEITRILNRQGIFIGRVNSYQDIHHGAEGHPEIEPGYYNVDGDSKRFFKEREIRALWERDYRLSKIFHKSIDRYEKPKLVYEFSATRL